jgi:transmembrane sensor
MARPPSIEQQAAHWMVALTADDEPSRASARAAFERWKQADPQHAQEARRLEGLLERLQGLRAVGEGEAGRGRPLRAALQAGLAVSAEGRAGGRLRRHGLMCLLAAAVLAPLCAALLGLGHPFDGVDVRAGVGEQQAHTLADGTRVVLRGETTVELALGPKQRTLKLKSGEMWMDVAKDPERPFVVETEHGQVRALGTRLVVARLPQATTVSMLESRVAVTSASSWAEAENGRLAPVVVSAGERVRMDAQGVTPLPDFDVALWSEAWQRRQWVVTAQPLPDVLDELDRHRPGRITYERSQIQHLLVSGVLPLDDTDKALELLATGFPVLRMRAWSPYWVRVDAPPAP